MIRASGIHPDRGVAINAAASAGSELVLETGRDLEAIEVQLRLAQEPRP